MRRCAVDQKWKHQKRAATRGAYRVANQQRMAARRALEWIGTSKAWLVFRYEISDLFGHVPSFFDAYHKCFCHPFHVSGTGTRN